MCVCVCSQLTEFWKISLQCKHCIIVAAFFDSFSIFLFLKCWWRQHALYDWNIFSWCDQLMYERTRRKNVLRHTPYDKRLQAKKCRVKNYLENNESVNEWQRWIIEWGDNAAKRIQLLTFALRENFCTLYMYVEYRSVVCKYAFLKKKRYIRSKRRYQLSNILNSHNFYRKSTI